MRVSGAQRAGDKAVVAELVGAAPPLGCRALHTPAIRAGLASVQPFCFKLRGVFLNEASRVGYALLRGLSLLLAILR